MFTFDLKSGYHYVDIHEASQSYPGFTWGEGCDKKFYVFRVLPFGLASACYIFTKLLRPLVKRWRSMGLHVVLYIDDGVCASATEAKLIEDRDIILSDLEHAGFVLNIAKSHQPFSQRSNCCRSRKYIRWHIPVHAIFAVFYLFFLPVLSRPSFTSRTPNKDQKTEQLFYFQLVQVP